jgi:hypothetical protein
VKLQTFIVQSSDLHITKGYVLREPTCAEGGDKGFVVVSHKKKPKSISYFHVMTVCVI